MDFDKDKIRTKIAISRALNERKSIEANKMQNIIKIITTTLAGILISSGVVFAGSKIYESIWKTPEKVDIPSGDFYEITKITEESKKENMSEEEAKEIAIKKLNEINFNSNIVSTNHYKEYDSNKIWYRFLTEDNYEITIDGQTGEFFDIWNHNKDIQDLNKYITVDEAIEVANKYYKLFGFKEGEYEITRIHSNNKDGNDKEPGFKIDIDYCKKYGDLENYYERISVAIESKNKDIDYFRVVNIPFDNNELVVTEEEAKNIALDEDKKIDTYNVERIETKLMIVKMNADAYNRINNEEKYYEEIQTANYPAEDRNYYKVDDKIRKAWVVVLYYEDKFNDVRRRYTEGIYTYFVDATTGEIIGGHPYDYIRLN